MDLLEQGYGPESLSPPGVQSQRKPEALPCDHCFHAKVTEFCVLSNQDSSETLDLCSHNTKTAQSVTEKQGIELSGRAPA